MSGSADPHGGTPFRDVISGPIGRVSDLYRLLRAIEETMPDGAILYVEGTTIATDIQSFLAAHQARQGEIRPIKAGTVYPVAATYHLPPRGSNLAELRELAEGHAEPEVCDHLAVYTPGELLLTAYDAGDGDIEAGAGLPEHTRRQFELALGSALEPR